MRLSATRLFPLVLMLVLALLSFWLERTAREAPARPGQQRHDPDYSVDSGDETTALVTLVCQSQSELLRGESAISLW